MNSQLEDIQKQLSEAKADKTEDTRSKKKAELIDNLKRLFPGVYGRLADLCEPVHKRYAVAVTKVLGKNMEAIVVDTEKTGRECLQYMKEQVRNLLAPSPSVCDRLSSHTSYTRYIILHIFYSATFFPAFLRHPSFLASSLLLQN